MKLETLGSEILYLRIVIGIKVKYYPLKQFFGTQMCIHTKMY